jgi:NADPH-dependent 2,4-dienoyl-CoA reductase/sulfur reductase-like enzyme
MRYVDILIVGGGSAGLAAAIAAKQQGVQEILIVERAPYLGGILRQCIHNGFGMHKFGEDLTGVEYAKRYVDQINDLGISYLTDTFVLDISPELAITMMNPTDGLIDIQAKAVVLAMGCRERSRGALLIPGSRCAGIFTAGTAQRFLNIEGYLPGRRVVILGSGDIGLIMARQFTIEGAKVEAVVEIMPHSSGLARNIVQCLEDFCIPIYYNSTVVDIHGRDRVEAVTIAEVDENRQPIASTEWVAPCDTLLISAGLIPENELSKGAGIALADSTKGAEVDETFQTSLPGVFSCGNVLHVHDLVDYVSLESEAAGRNAARYVQGTLPAVPHQGSIPVQDGEGVRGVVPQYIRRSGDTGDKIRFMFRPDRVYKDCTICFDVDGQLVARKKARVLVPGEMSEIVVARNLINSDAAGITVRIETQ